MIKHSIIIFLLLIIFPGQSFSEDEPPLKEIFQSTLVYPQEQGELQLIFSPKYDDGDEFQQWKFPVSVEYGLTNALQIELEWSALIYNAPNNEDSSSGIGDLSIGAQYSWMNIAALPLHAALNLDFGIPTGDKDKDLGEGKFAFEPTLIFAWDLPFRRDTQVFINTGAEINDNEEDPFVNLGFFTPIGNTIFTAEWNWNTKQRYFTPGLVIHPFPGWEFGLGVPIGLNQEADNTRVIFNLTYEP